MGQIVGLKAKPKRCNLNKLSQLGTPAAGEYILVSYDNSMTANGQGNFDRYIMGDGRTAATALELKYLDDSTRPYIVEEVNKAVADIQPIEITGDVTNAPDEEDLTSENQGGTDVLKFKDKAYNAALYSGLGRVYLRKNIVTLEGTGKNVLTQAMVNTANTIYHIQYDYDLNGQTITLPAGCVLKFDGGSVKNGTITLNGTSVVSDYACFSDDVTVNGTIDNDYVYSRWFKYDDDFSNSYIKIVTLANSSNKPIIIKKGTYTVKSSVNNVICKQSIDFCNSTFILDANEKNLQLKFSNSEWVQINSSEYSSLLEKVNNKTRDYAGYENSLLNIINSNETSYVRYSVNYRKTKNDVIYIDSSGYRTNDFFNDSYNEISNAFQLSCSGRMTVKNVAIKLRDSYGIHSTDDYRRVGLLFKDSSNVVVENIVIEEPLPNDIQILLEATTTYNIILRNISLSSTARTTNVSSYSLSFNSVIKLTMDNVKVAALQDSKWGATGSDFIVDWTIINSDLSRIDAHGWLNNLTVRDSNIGRYGITYTGWGRIFIDNCKINADALLIPRSDYGSFFDGDIIISNCELNGVQWICYLNVVPKDEHDFEYATSKFNYKGFRTLTVKNCMINDVNNLFGIRVYVPVNVSSICDNFVHPQKMIFDTIYGSFNNFSPIEKCTAYPMLFDSSVPVSIDLNNIECSGTNPLFLVPVYITGGVSTADSGFFDLNIRANNCTNIGTRVYWTSNLKAYFNNCIFPRFYDLYSIGDFSFSDCDITPINNNNNRLSNGADYHFSSCVFHSCIVEDAAEMDAFNKAFYKPKEGNVLFGNTNNFRIDNCRVDAQLMEILGLTSEYVIDYKRLTSHGYSYVSRDGRPIWYRVLYQAIVSSVNHPMYLLDATVEYNDTTYYQWECPSLDVTILTTIINPPDGSACYVYDTNSTTVISYGTTQKTSGWVDALGNSLGTVYVSNN